MKLSSEYNQKYFSARNRWIVKNPNLLVMKRSAFLEKEWSSALQTVASDGKAIALVDSCLSAGERQYGLRGVILPKEFLDEYLQRFLYNGDEVNDISAIDFGQNTTSYLDSIQDKGFLQVNARQEKKRILIAGCWLTTIINIGVDSRAVLLPEQSPPENLNAFIPYSCS